MPNQTHKLIAKRQKEIQTITFMMQLYDQHHQGDSSQLLAYAKERIDQCPIMEKKTFCSACTIHCYQKRYQEEMKVIMRYAGVRMLWHHPLLALSHVYQTRKHNRTMKKKNRY